MVLSVGGATYPYSSFTVANATSIVDLALDLECTGIDIDWEPAGGASDASQLSGIIDTFASVNKGLTLSLASFSVGCYGYGDFVDSTPASSNTGMDYPGIVASGKNLNWINLMSYDASSAYDPIEGFKSIRAIYNGPILIGIENAPQAWGGFQPTDQDIATWANYAISNNGGVFVWSLQKQGTPTISEIYADIQSGFSGKTTVAVPNPSSGTVSAPVSTPVTKPATNPVNTPVITPVNSDPSVVAWVPGIHVSVGEIVSFDGQKYSVIKAHNTQSDWPPNIVPALFKLL